MNGNLVTVIIPAYNAQEHLEICIQSAIEQSYKNLEILLIDDGSTDATLAIAKQLAESDARISVFHQENKGVSAARNFALSLAKGDYITMLDADDILPSKAVEILVSGIEDADLVIGSHATFRGNRYYEEVKPEMAVTTAFFYDDPLTFQCYLWGVVAKLYKRSIITNHNLQYDEALPFWEDMLFTWQYCKYSDKIRVVSDVVYLYRRGGIASTVKYYPNMGQYFLSAIEVYADYYGGLEQIPQSFLRGKVTDEIVYITRHHVEHCARREALQKIKELFAMCAFLLDEYGFDRSRCHATLADAIEARDAEKMVRVLYRLEYKKILIKKLKKLYYRFFTKRL